MRTYEKSAIMEEHCHVLVAGVPFAPGTDVEVTMAQFEKAADLLVERLPGACPQAAHVMQPYLLFMRKL